MLILSMASFQNIYFCSETLKLAAVNHCANIWNNTLLHTICSKESEFLYFQIVLFNNSYESFSKFFFINPHIFCSAFVPPWRMSWGEQTSEGQKKRQTLKKLSAANTYCLNVMFLKIRRTKMRKNPTQDLRDVLSFSDHLMYDKFSAYNSLRITLFLLKRIVFC